MIEVYPTYDEMAYRIELFGDEIEPSRRSIRSSARCGRNMRACRSIPNRITSSSRSVRRPPSPPSWRSSPSGKSSWNRKGGWSKSQRIHQRTRFDLEMIKSMGYCHGIENYSRHFSGRLPGRTAAHPAGLLPARLPGVH